MSPAVTYAQQTAVRDAVKEYLRRNKGSLRAIVRYVYEMTGYKPAPSTISRIVKEIQKQK